MNSVFEVEKSSDKEANMKAEQQRRSLAVFLSFGILPFPGKTMSTFFYFQLLTFPRKCLQVNNSSANDKTDSTKFCKLDLLYL